MTNPDLIERARRWIAQDPDPRSCDELKLLINSNNTAELTARFCGPLSFGTAGLRGLLGAGESRMNRAVIRRVTFGLGSALLQHVDDAATRGVVIGYDGRRLSLEFAQDAASVLLARGFRIYLWRDLGPTPLVPYAMGRFRAAAGVMVTASHNPPDYNGYKVYAENGAQIIPPIDRQIATAIDAAPAANAIELADYDGHEKLTWLDDDLREAYLADVAKLVEPGPRDTSITIAYTALHGVGQDLVQRTLAQHGYNDFHGAEAQAVPDGEFPTVAFPNPEEDGAMDLVFELGSAVGADLVLANDPDADRLSVAVPTTNGFRQFTGNEVGALLGNYLIAKSSGPKRLVLASLVSSPLLGVIAASADVDYAETLTGFKWIANTAMQRAKTDGQRFVFGYEEALGYCVGTLIPDKDGVSAALAMCHLAAELKAKGETLLDELARIFATHGVHLSRQESLRFEGTQGVSIMAAHMSRLRETAPTKLCGQDVVSATDLQKGQTVFLAEGRTEPVNLPSSDVLTYRLADASRIIVRPSGTEPKLKIYIDVSEPVTAKTPVDQARQRAETKLKSYADQMLTLFADA